MKKYKYIEPEVAGGFGTETVLNANVHPPVVERLHYEFQGWLGDDLLESFPCFIVTEQLANEISFQKLTGIFFDDVKITTSELFSELYPEKSFLNFAG